MDAQNLDDLSHHFTEKLSVLSEGLAIQSCVEIVDEDERAETCLPMQSLWQEVDELSDVLILAKSKCADQRKTLAGVQAVKDKLVLLLKGLQYTTNNLPPHLPALSSASSHESQCVNQTKVEQNTGNPVPLKSQTPGVTANAKTPSQSASKPNPAVSKQQQPPCPLMEYLIVEEFNNIPKYMKGRLTYQQVNAVVDELNKAFIAKYKVLRQKKSTLNDVNRKRYEAFKMQESKDTKGVFFLVEKDIKEWSSLKMSRETHSLFTVLRHCGRLCEIRGDGHIRYAIIEMY